MNILLSIGARAEDVRSMRMTDIGTSMVAGLGKSEYLTRLKLRYIYRL